MEHCHRSRKQGSEFGVEEKMVVVCDGEQRQKQKIVEMMRAEQDENWCGVVW